MAAGTANAMTLGACFTLGDVENVLVVWTSPASRAPPDGRGTSRKGMST